MAQTLFLVNRVHNVMGNFNQAMSNWVQRGNPDRFKFVEYGPKNSRGYYIKLKKIDNVAENIPLPFLNSNSKIEELDQQYGLEMWRNPRITPSHMSARSMKILFENDWVKLGLLTQKVVGATEFTAQFDSYMSALDFQLELIAMWHVGKVVQPKEFRYNIELPKELVYYTEKGRQQLDLLSDDIVSYENVYSINQEKFLICNQLTPTLTPQFPQPPQSRIDGDSLDTYIVNFSVGWSIELPMWLVLDTHFQVDSFSINLKVDFESGGGMPAEDFTQSFLGNDVNITYYFQEMSQFLINETAFHNIKIETGALPDWLENDTIKIYVNNEVLSNYILADNEISFGKYMEKNSVIWVARYSRQPKQTINLLADAGGELIVGSDPNDTIGL